MGRGTRAAEKLNAPVWAAPFAERTPFPETHKQFAGALPSAIGPLAKKLEGHDLVVVIGAPVFRYYPFVAGRLSPSGKPGPAGDGRPGMSGKAPVGDSLLATPALASRN